MHFVAYKNDRAAYCICAGLRSDRVATELVRPKSRSVVLPDGMKPALALRLEEMVSRHVDAVNDSIDDEEPEWPFEFGITVFLEIAKNRVL